MRTGRRSAPLPHPVWTVILAAGAGRRLARLTGGVPKQYWEGFGSSLLEQTLARFAPLSSRAQTAVIVDAGHLQYRVAARLAATLPTPLIVQPQDRGTAAGVLLALTPVLNADPDSIVILTPSDHGVEGTAGCQESLRSVVREVDRSDRIVLIGAEATHASQDYGWISLDRSAAAGAFRPVSRFVEKPAAAPAAALFEAGAVWNTMVLVARARAIRDLCLELIPEVAAPLADAAGLLARGRADFLHRTYATLPARDFSRDVLSRAHNLTAHVWPAAIGWSDLGTPDRMLNWQQRAVSAA